MHYRRVLRTGDPGPAGPARQRSTCSAPGCDKPHDAEGLCHGHYQRLQRTGRRDVSPLREGEKMCAVEGCNRPHKARGYCAAHYKRALAHSHPMADVPIREVAGTGFVDGHGYFVVPIPREHRHLVGGATKTGEHRLVMARHLGRALAPDEQVHHINGVRTDNRLENLELWSTSHPSGRRVDDLPGVVSADVGSVLGGGLGRCLVVVRQCPLNSTRGPDGI